MIRTGQQQLDFIRDGREVYVNAEAAIGGMHAYAHPQVQYP
jgi:hypothetical protein